MEPIAFLTDLHLDEQFPIDNDVNPGKNWERILADLSTRNIKHVVYGGDIGEASAYPYFFESLKPFSLDLILGNHDTFKGVVPYYRKDDRKDELFYQKETANWKFLFLDSSTEELSKVQTDWLESAIQTQQHLIIFIHHPVLEIDTAVDKLYPLKNRDLVKNILVSNGNPVTLFTGHYHMNDERQFKNIRQIVTESLSYQIVKQANELAIDNSSFGYRIIEFKEDQFHNQFINFV